MKLGLKLFGKNILALERFKDLFDFFEIYVEPDMKLQSLENIQVPLTIHVAHHSYGFNAADPAKKRLNKRILQHAFKAADLADAQWLVVHPGYAVSSDAEKVMLPFFDQFSSKRLLFENCPHVDYSEKKEHYLFSTPETMRNLLERFKAKMALDFGHAVCSANVLGVSPYRLIDEFFALHPPYFHLSGIDSTSRVDTHKHLFEVEHDYSYLRRIKKQHYLTLETWYPGSDGRSVCLKDLDIIRRFSS